MKTILIDGIEHYTRGNPRGYGYQIMKKVPREDNPERFYYYEVFCSKDKELVKELFTRLEEGELDIELDLPDTSDEIYPEKMLVFNSKHFIGYYSVPTYEVLRKTMRHILTQEYNYNGKGEYIENMRPENQEHNDSGVNSQEEIDSIPIEGVRESVQEKWNAYQKRIKRDVQYARDWENLKEVVTTEDEGNPHNAMEAFEQGNYEFETLITI